MRFMQLLLLIFLLAVLCVEQQAIAAAPATTTGNSTLTVHVTYEGSHRPAAGLHVELVSPFGGVVDMRTTDGNGAASFEDVGGGRYQLRVSGPDIQTMQSEAIDVGGSQGGPHITENLQVRLTKTSEGAVGASNAFYIPYAARQEMILGSKEMEKKHWEEAKHHFRKAIGIFPKYAEAFNALGVAEARLRNGKSAVEAFRSATQINPGLREANLYLGQFYYENSQYRNAEPYLARASADQPNNAQLLTALANSELHNGETGVALADARRVPSLPNHKQYAISHLIVAQALAGKGHDDEIAKEYEAYLRDAPESSLAPRVKDALANLQVK